VRLYTTARCGYCLLLKRFLDYRHVAYDEIDVDRDPQAAAQLEAWTGGYRTVPTVELGGRVLVNPRGPDVLAALVQEPKPAS